MENDKVSLAGSIRVKGHMRKGGVGGKSIRVKGYMRSPLRVMAGMIKDAKSSGHGALDTEEVRQTVMRESGRAPTRIEMDRGRRFAAKSGVSISSMKKAASMRSATKSVEDLQDKAAAAEKTRQAKRVVEARKGAVEKVQVLQDRTAARARLTPEVQARLKADIPENGGENDGKVLPNDKVGQAVVVINSRATSVPNMTQEELTKAKNSLEGTPAWDVLDKEDKARAAGRARSAAEKAPDTATDKTTKPKGLSDKQWADVQAVGQRTKDAQARSGVKRVWEAGDPEMGRMVTVTSYGDGKSWMVFEQKYDDAGVTSFKKSRDFKSEPEAIKYAKSRAIKDSDGTIRPNAAQRAEREAALREAPVLQEDIDALEPERDAAAAKYLESRKPVTGPDARAEELSEVSGIAEEDAEVLLDELDKRASNGSRLDALEVVDDMFNVRGMGEDYSDDQMEAIVEAWMTSGTLNPNQGGFNGTLTPSPATKPMNPFAAARFDDMDRSFEDEVEMRDVQEIARSYGIPINHAVDYVEAKGWKILGGPPEDAAPDGEDVGGEFDFWLAEGPVGPDVPPRLGAYRDAAQAVMGEADSDINDVVVAEAFRSAGETPPKGLSTRADLKAYVDGMDASSFEMESIQDFLRGVLAAWTARDSMEEPMATAVDKILIANPMLDKAQALALLKAMAAAEDGVRLSALSGSATVSPYGDAVGRERDDVVELSADEADRLLSYLG